MVNGRLLGGFAVVAWPAQYGETGIKTIPQLLAILDLPDSKLAAVIVKTLRRA